MRGRRSLKNRQPFRADQPSCHCLELEQTRSVADATQLSTGDLNETNGYGAQHTVVQPAQTVRSPRGRRPAIRRNAIANCPGGSKIVGAIQRDSATRGLDGASRPHARTPAEARLDSPRASVHLMRAQLNAGSPYGPTTCAGRRQRSLSTVSWSAMSAQIRL
jgi:hypothetical protein